MIKKCLITDDCIITGLLREPKYSDDESGFNGKFAVFHLVEVKEEYVLKKLETSHLYTLTNYINYPETSYVNLNVLYTTQSFFVGSILAS